MADRSITIDEVQGESDLGSAAPPIIIHRSLKMKKRCAHLGAQETRRSKRKRRELAFVVSCIILPIHAPWLYPSMLFDNMKDALRGERLSSEEAHQASVHEWYRNNLKECFHKATRKAQRDHMVVE
jgi:hypothetical protein